MVIVMKETGKIIIFKIMENLNGLMVGSILGNGLIVNKMVKVLWHFLTVIDIKETGDNDHAKIKFNTFIFGN